MCKAIIPDKNDDTPKQLLQDIIELVEHCASFSNGVGELGEDEGDIMGWRIWNGYMQRAAKMGVIEERVLFTQEGVEDTSCTLFD